MSIMMEDPHAEFQGIIGKHDSRRDKMEAQKNRAMERRTRMGGGSAHRSMSEIGATICGAGYGGDKGADGYQSTGGYNKQEKPAAGGYIASRRKMIAPPGGGSMVNLGDGQAGRQESIFGFDFSKAADATPAVALDAPKPAANKLSYAEELAAQIAMKKALDSAAGHNVGMRRNRGAASLPNAQEDAPAAGGRAPSRGRSREAVPGAGDSLSLLMAERGASVNAESRNASHDLAARRAAVPGLEDCAPPRNPEAAVAARPPRPSGSGGNILTGGSDRQDGSSNRYANGMNQNCGNVITDRPTSRVLKPPGGGSSFSFA